MNKNLVPISTLKKIAAQKGLMKYIKEIGYSKAKGKKYYVITIDNKKVNWGYNKMDDFLTHHDPIRQKRFKQRFKSLYDKFKNDYNRAIFWSYNLLW